MGLDAFLFPFEINNTDLMGDILNAPLSPICQVDYCWQIEIATFVDVMDGIWC